MNAENRALNLTIQIWPGRTCNVASRPCAPEGRVGLQLMIPTPARSIELMTVAILPWLDPFEYRSERFGDSCQKQPCAKVDGPLERAREVPSPTAWRMVQPLTDPETFERFPSGPPDLWDALLGLKLQPDSAQADAECSNAFHETAPDPECVTDFRDFSPVVSTKPTDFCPEFSESGDLSQTWSGDLGRVT
jgi:hypothetical protein